jgi:4-hydroxy-3-polyprenylbenzoate decarboxylase
MSQPNKHKIVVAVTGASGSIYAKVLFDKLQTLHEQIEDVGVVMSDNARDVWKFELGNTDYEKLPFKIYSKNDFFSPFASVRQNTIL